MDRLTLMRPRQHVGTGAIEAAGCRSVPRTAERWRVDERADSGTDGCEAYGPTQHRARGWENGRGREVREITRPLAIIEYAASRVRRAERRLQKRRAASSVSHTEIA